MKTLLMVVLIISLICLLTSCGLQPSKCYQTVKDAYPYARVYKLDSKYSFLVITDTQVRLVGCWNETNCDITDDILLEEGQYAIHQ